MGNYLLPVRDLVAEFEADLPSGVAHAMLALTDEFSSILGEHDAAA